jgi:UDP-glucose 4-epimerase
VIGVEYVNGDVGGREALREAMAGARLVAHFADATLPQTAEKSPQADLSANLAAVHNVLNLCEEHGVERILYCSSGGAVYGVPSVLPIAESAPPRPISSYGLIKQAVEDAVRSFCPGRGIEHVILRPSNVYGPDQSPFRPQGIIAAAMLAALRGEAVTVFGDGSVVRDFLYIGDFTRFFMRCLAAKVRAVTINAGSGQGHSLGHVLDLVGSISGRPLAVKRLPPRDFDVPVNYLDVSLAGRLLGWKPGVGLEEGLRLTHEGFLRRFSGPACESP